jgi:hypothetical protein
VHSFQINSKCTALNLDGNDIDEEGIMYLSGVMEENTTITHLVRFGFLTFIQNIAISSKSNAG